jgi:hypothetical protein
VQSLQGFLHALWRGEVQGKQRDPLQIQERYSSDKNYGECDDANFVAAVDGCTESTVALCFLVAMHMEYLRKLELYAICLWRG